VPPQAPLCCTCHPYHWKAIELSILLVGVARSAGTCSQGALDPVPGGHQVTPPPLSPSPPPFPLIPTPHPPPPPPAPLGTMATTLHSGETTAHGWLLGGGLKGGGLGRHQVTQGAPSDPCTRPHHRPPPPTHTHALALCGGAVWGGVGVVGTPA